MALDDENDRDFLRRIGSVRWCLALPRPGYRTYRSGLHHALVPVRRGVAIWFLKRFAVGLALVLALEVAVLVFLEPYVVLVYGSRRFGSLHQGDGTTLGFFLLAVWLFALVLAALVTQVRTQRALLNLYEASLEEPWRQELIVGERGLLIETPHSRMLLRWESARRLVGEKGHWFLVFSAPVVAIAIPVPVVEALPDGEAFLGFLRERAGGRPAVPAPPADIP